MRSCQGMGIEKVRKDDTARTFEFLFRFNRVWIAGYIIIIIILLQSFQIIYDVFIF